MNDVIKGCLACPVGRKKIARTRGICQGCYQNARQRIRKKTTTWEAEIAAGRALRSVEELGIKRDIMRTGSTARKIKDGNDRADRSLQGLLQGGNVAGGALLQGPPAAVKVQ